MQKIRLTGNKNTMGNTQWKSYALVANGAWKYVKIDCKRNNVDSPGDTAQKHLGDVTKGKYGPKKDQQINLSCLDGDAFVSLETYDFDLDRRVNVGTSEYSGDNPEHLLTGRGVCMRFKLCKGDRCELGKHKDCVPTYGRLRFLRGGATFGEEQEYDDEQGEFVSINMGGNETWDQVMDGVGLMSEIEDINTASLN